MRIKPVIGSLIRTALAPVGSLVSIRTRHPHLVLTFDDGPDPDVTPRILEILAQADAHATFFVLGTRVCRQPHILGEMVAAGHEVGLHGIDHRRLTTAPRKEVLERLVRGKAELEDRIGQPVRWFRPPYGAQSLATWQAIRAAGMRSVMWGATLWDWKDIDDDARLAKANQGIEPGAILLGHDGIADASDLAEPMSPGNLNRAHWFGERFSDYRAQGFTGMSLGEALRTGRPVWRGVFAR